MKFPLNLPRVARKPNSPARNLAFGRVELESALRFLDPSAFADAVEKLRQGLALLPPATVHELGCRECNGDVPRSEANLMEDRICRPCADAYDAAMAERRARMRAARLDQKCAA